MPNPEETADGGAGEGVVPDSAAGAPGQPLPGEGVGCWARACMGAAGATGCTPDTFATCPVVPGAELRPVAVRITVTAPMPCSWRTKACAWVCSRPCPARRFFAAMALAMVGRGTPCFADRAAARRVSPAGLESEEPTTNTSKRLPAMTPSIWAVRVCPKSHDRDAPHGTNDQRQWKT